ncbi:MAG: hypothetical protein M3069_30040 [Chloroflexota bacterium]|nr:hypothetical protein [Chloroflexota bacterium]
MANSGGLFGAEDPHAVGPVQPLRVAEIGRVRAVEVPLDLEHTTIISIGVITCGADGESMLPRAGELRMLPRGDSSQAIVL